MSELEELIAQKKALEARIKALKNSTVRVGGAKLEQATYAARESEWFVAVKRRVFVEDERRDIWYSIVRANDKRQAIEEIPSIITDLARLYEQLTSDE